jgi:hypothetical protein
MNAIIPYRRPKYSTLKEEASAHFSNHHRIWNIMYHCGDPEGRSVYTICRDDRMNARIMAIAERCIKELEESVRWGEDLLARFEAADAGYEDYHYVQDHTDEDRTQAYDMRMVMEQRFAPIPQAAPRAAPARPARRKAAATPALYSPPPPPVYAKSAPTLAPIRTTSYQPPANYAPPPPPTPEPAPAPTAPAYSPAEWRPNVWAIVACAIAVLWLISHLGH